NTFTNVYGHDSFVINELHYGDTEFIIRNGGNERYVIYSYKAGVLYRGVYKLIDNSGEEGAVNILYEDTPVLDVTQEGFKYGATNVLFTSDDYDITVNVYEDGSLRYELVCKQNVISFESLYTVSANRIPDYFKGEISKEFSEITVYSNGEEVETNSEGRIICVGEKLYFADVTDDKIMLVEIAYSKTLTFNEFTVLYEAGGSRQIYYDNDEDGMYKIRITNVYGNVTEYLFSLSTDFNIFAVVTYADGEQSEYVYKEGLEIYLNGKVTLTAIGTNIGYTVNGEEATAEKNEDSYSITLSVLGTTKRYDVVARDEGGVERRFSFILGKDASFSFNDGWIYGYNEDALLKKDGYTNKPLSVRWNESIYQVVVMKEGGTEQTVVYDLLSQNKKTEISAFTDCIGCDGDGAYTVIFRSKFGDKVTKTVYYRETPTLVLTRSTLVKGYVEDYDLADALELGFYSSNSLVFDSTAELFNLSLITGDGSEIVPAQFPYLLEFGSDSGNGSFEYTVRYVDCYGFKYEFTACLYRQEIKIDTTQMDLITIERTVYTRDKVAVTFAESLSGTVSYNGGQAKAYRSGSELLADGTYRFEVTDIAGNMASFTVVHDSIIKYTLSTTSTGINVLKGGVVNSDSVTFRLLDNDSGYIKHVIYNGEEQVDYALKSFTMNGYWQLLIRDGIGNSSYFDFYLVNHAVKQFDYTAPDGFTVSEVWITENSEKFLTPIKGDTIQLKNDGQYALVLSSLTDHVAYNFTVTIDHTPPEVTLVGCENGGVTPQ
ncbi:MAG: hypothetical protein MJ072_01745, partial [Clostridia bacterium]|nr:hypothetical protein [Clostridia bacterium]